jgi:hypothetical protein
VIYTFECLDIYKPGVFSTRFFGWETSPFASSFNGQTIAGYRAFCCWIVWKEELPTANGFMLRLPLHHTVILSYRTLQKPRFDNSRDKFINFTARSRIVLH